MNRMNDYQIDDVAQDLADIGKERRAMSTSAHWTPAERHALRVQAHTASRMDAAGALNTFPHVTRAGLIDALEEALMVGGDRDRAFATLAMAKDEDWLR